MRYSRLLKIMGLIFIIIGVLFYKFKDRIEYFKDKEVFNTGVILYNQGDYKGAEALFLKASQSSYSNIRKSAFYNLGNTYVMEERYKEAVRAYENALRIDPKDWDAKFNLERLYVFVDSLKEKKNGEDEKSADQYEMELEERDRISRGENYGHGRNPRGI
jgi:tetratricopeptide (TPR) repeat protein